MAVKLCQHKCFKWIHSASQEKKCQSENFVLGDFEKGKTLGKLLQQDEPPATQDLVLIHVGCKTQSMQSTGFF